jgi:hypothetical protein
VTVAIVAAALVVGLVGRGASGSSLASAADRMQGQNMRLKLTMGVSDPRDGDAAVSMTGVSSADGSRSAGRGVYDPKAKGPSVTMDIRMIRDDMWMHVIGLPGVMPKGKRWVHMVDRSHAPETLTPAEFTRFLADADGVEVVGEDEPMGGDVTTHYQGTVNIQEIADELQGESKARLERLTRGRRADLPIDAWIGRDGLPKRISVSASGAGSSADITVDVLEYGVPVDVSPPPAAQVIEEDAWNVYLEAPTA